MRPDLYRPPASRARGRRLHWLPEPSGPVKMLILLALMVGLGASGKRFLAPGVEWGDDLREGFRLADEQNQPLLVLYTADWSPSCRTLEHAVLEDRKVHAFLAGEYVLVKVDLTDRQGINNQLAARARVSNIPTVIVYGPRGREVKRLTGGAIDAWLRSQVERSDRARKRI